MTLTWDANNRVKQINSTTYNYDPSGYRIKKTGSTTNNYYLEGEHLEAIYNNSGIVQAQYLRGSVIDEIVNLSVNKEMMVCLSHLLKHYGYFRAH
jgi:hypothetical protein